MAALTGELCGSGAPGSEASTSVYVLPSAYLLPPPDESSAPPPQAVRPAAREIESATRALERTGLMGIPLSSVLVGKAVGVRAARDEDGQRSARETTRP